jgi:hypothetical protein
LQPNITSIAIKPGQIMKSIIGNLDPMLKERLGVGGGTWPFDGG